MISKAVTWLTSNCYLKPDPWVAVIIDPTTFICGSDGRLASALPASSTCLMSSEYVIPAPK